MGLVLVEEAWGFAAFERCSVGEGAELRAAVGALQHEVAVAFCHFKSSLVVGAGAFVGDEFAPGGADDDDALVASVEVLVAAEVVEARVLG